jgi:hypothetical protein
VESATECVTRDDTMLELTVNQVIKQVIITSGYPILKN